MKLADILEIPVDGSEANVSDFVDVLQPVHDEFTEFGSGPFPLRRIYDKLLNFIHDLFHTSHGDGPLLASPQYPSQYLLPFKLLQAAVFLDDHVWDLIDTLIGREAFFALQALAAPADGSALF